ncbi:MAG: 4Fe-4S ferredoxin [Candidatus Heimdallarchaeota archaeon]|nr:4Fe-4S ferredoxin [Candidatus Heimdallarchaeota archaeon]
MSTESGNIYLELRKHLDTHPVGYPETKSGVEIRILKHLFSPKEAKIALKLNIMPQDSDFICDLLKDEKWSKEEISESLRNMGKKGSVTWVNRNEIDYYALAPLVVGMYEYQLNRLTVEFLHDFEQYLDEGYSKEVFASEIPQLRTIPIEESLTHENYVSNYDELRKLVENSSKFSVAECICRKSTKMLGKGCEHTLERCFQFGAGSYTYLNQGLAREITKEEALNMLKDAQEEGFVLQPTNAQKIISICCCCGCSCEYLRNLAKLEKPALHVASNYFARVDEAECTGCGVCETRCHMDAIKVNEDGISEVDLDRCIGCGVCIPTCASEAVILVKKEKELPPPPNMMEMYKKIAMKKLNSL